MYCRRFDYHRKQVPVLEDRQFPSPFPCKVSLWSSGFFLTIPVWLQLTSASSFGKNFLHFALGCQVFAVPFLSCLCNIPINYLFSCLSLSSVPITASNGEITLYPSSLVFHKKIPCLHRRGSPVYHPEQSQSSWVRWELSIPALVQPSLLTGAKQEGDEGEERFLASGWCLCSRSARLAERTYSLPPVRCGYVLTAPECCRLSTRAPIRQAQEEFQDVNFTSGKIEATVLRCCLCSRLFLRHWSRCLTACRAIILM